MTTEATWFASAIAEDVTAPGVTYLEALRSALGDLLAEDERVLLLGEDIGTMGGAFRVTAGLRERFGTSRVIDTPMSETAIVGCAIGLALAGLRPIVELQFADFISCCYDQLVNEAAKLHYRFGIAVPIVVRCPAGGGLGAGPFHSQSPEGIFAHVAGLKVVCPATVQDAYSLLRAAVADPDPVLFFEQKALYRSQKAPLERSAAPAMLGRAALRREGSDLTVVTYGSMVPRCLEAAALLAVEGVEGEVVDLVSLVPFDVDTVAASVRKTGRLAVVHEDTYTAGFGAEVVARLAESDVLYHLDAPVCRITAPDTPVPSAPALEQAYVPSTSRILAALGSGWPVPEREEDTATPWPASPAGASPLPSRWREPLELMLLSRSIENKLHNLFLQGRVRGRVISGRGQEAIPVGAATCTGPGDLVCPAHRDLGAHLARGTTAREVFLQYLWRAEGPSGGRDGDVHFGVWSKGVLPMISHLPDSWPIAAGLAMAKSQEGGGGVVVAFCGDGATSAGVWHESVNLASVWQLPIVLVVENNQYAYSTPNAQQFRVATIAERAAGYGIPGWRVDGNDVAAVHEVVGRAVAAARAGAGPTLIEAVTMRIDGHAIHDAAEYVPRELLEHWRRRDPIELFVARLAAAGLLDGSQLAAMRAVAEGQADRAYEEAAAAPEPTADSLQHGVYAAPPPPPRTRPAHS